MKKIAILLLLVGLWGPVSVQAHSALTTSTPAEGESVEQPLEEVQLNFEGGIEQGSTMTIESDEGNYEFENITVTEQTMVGTLTDGLPNGAYAVSWQIISADGHPLEGEIPFEVNIEAAEQEPAVEQEEPEEVEETVMEENPAEETSGEPQGNDTTEEGGTSLLVTLLIAAAVILLVTGLYWLLIKKR